MSDLILYGSLIGAMLGGLHFIQFLTSRLGKPGTTAPWNVWHGLCNWALWTVFGAYILLFWIVGLVLYLLFSLTASVGAQR